MMQKQQQQNIYLFIVHFATLIKTLSHFDPKLHKFSISLKSFIITSSALQINDSFLNLADLQAPILAQNWCCTTAAIYKVLI